MSIVDRIGSLVTEGRLTHIEPLDVGLAVKRSMVVADDIRHLIDGPWSTTSLERRANRLRADLEAFALGHVLGVSMTPYQHKSAYMGLLDPPSRGLWDIRSRDPKPGLRVFGHFADVDVFVALIWYPRSVETDGRPPLGDVQGPNWDIATHQCKSEWERLFPDHSPRTGEAINDFISGNTILV